MLLESLVYGEETFKVAIAELTNKNGLGRDPLLRMAMDFSKNLLAFQFLKPSLIAGIGHLLSASQNALNAWKGGYGIARSLDIEVALYASGQHQIGVALEHLGVEDGLDSIALVMIDVDEAKLKSEYQSAVEQLGNGVSPPFAPTDGRLRCIMEHFGISETEISTVSSSDSLEARFKALEGCVASRVSMVSLES
ncbi:MAG: KEOPS complex subunit Cgi121 [Candidatus Thorarchaeota archaeon]|jgi:tRNA threonylcarbamoyladenosine modification (KEOPS) complex Cgi121 subunit